MMHPLTNLLDGLAESNELLQPIGVNSLVCHSDAVQEGSLYLAMSGHRAHGLDFLETALARGACAVAWEPDERYMTLDCLIPSVCVPDLHRKAGIIADRFFDHPSAELHVVAVTGTNGKTSTAHFISEALSQTYSGCGLIGTLGNGVFGKLKKTVNTTPDALSLHQQMWDLRDKNIRHVVLEASSHGLVQGRLAGVRIDTAVFTLLGHDHFDYHGSKEKYKAAKKLLFKTSSLQHAIINMDDIFGRELIEFCRHQCELVTYSAEGRSADICAHNIEVNRYGLHFELQYGDFNATIENGLIGRFNITNLLAAFGVLLVQGVGAKSAASLLSKVQTIKGRMQSFIAKSPMPLVILDYAHTPDALESALQTCAEITRGDLHCVFGCGGNRDQGKRELMGEVASRLAHYVVITDDNPRDEAAEKIVADIVRGMDKHSDKLVVIHDRREAIQSAIFQAQRDDCVLVAGKGHETEQIVRGQSLPMDDNRIITEILAEIR